MAEFRSRIAIKVQYRIARSVKELKVPSEFLLILPPFHVIPFIESKFSSKFTCVFLKVVGHQKRSLPTTVLTTQTSSGLSCLVNCEVSHMCHSYAFFFWKKDKAFEPLADLAQHAGVRRFVVQCFARDHNSPL